MAEIFLHDESFIPKENRTNSDVFYATDVGMVSERGLTMFKTPYRLQDTRETRDDDLNIAVETKSTLILDKEYDSVFIQSLEGINAIERGYIFALIDQFVFSFDPNETVPYIEEQISTMPYGTIYRKDSLVFNTVKKEVPVYGTTETKTLTIPVTVQFSIQLSTNVVLTIRIWTSNEYFIERYTKSTIVGVLPPLDLNDLLTKPIIQQRTSTADNAFIIGLKSSALALSIMTPMLANDTITGCTEYQAKFIDSSDAYVYARFIIFYKGHTPGTLAIRTAIKEYLINSGVGTELQWKNRVPELFIEAQFFLLPMWDNKTVRPDQTVHPSTISMAKVRENTAKVLYDIDANFVQANIDIVSASYDKLTMSAVPYETNPVARRSFSKEHPTYQDYSPDDPNFAYMEEITKRFSIVLNNCLAVASGKAVSDEFVEIFIDERRFLSFTINDVEYFVIDNETYTNVLLA